MHVEVTLGATVPAEELGYPQFRTYVNATLEGEPTV